jgi:hypothetical protein
MQPQGVMAVTAAQVSVPQLQGSVFFMLEAEVVVLFRIPA